MTAEVALLNKTAVALAADSAMTIVESGNVVDPGKIYPVQKLFALATHHPVGVMIYNTAEFMDIPWETLIKMYRGTLGIESRPTVKDYLDDFLDFIGQEGFTTPHQEAENLLRMAGDLFRNVGHRAQRDDGSLKASIKYYRALFKRKARSQSMADVDVAAALSKCRDGLNDIIAGIFEDFEPTPQIKRSLVQLVGELIKSDAPTPSHSGVVIAGFGDDEFFPTLVSATVEGTVGGKVKHDVRRVVDIARDGTWAQIVPFAQREMVTRFMEGVDPEFLAYLSDSMGEASRQLVMEVLESMDIECSEEDANTVRLAAAEQADHYLQRAEAFRRDSFISPIMDIVEHLPKRSSRTWRKRWLASLLSSGGCRLKKRQWAVRSTLLLYPKATA